MRVVFDSQGHRLQSRGGISRYITMLAQALHENNIDVRVVAPIHRNEYLRAAEGLPRYAHYLKRNLVHRRIDAIVNSILEPIFLRISRPNIIHNTYYESLRSGGADARVITVHDMIHERFSEWHVGNPLARQKARAVADSDHIICISNKTRDDLCDILNVDPVRTSVVYHGACRLALPNSDIPNPAADGPYVLYVGQRYRYKNFSVLIDAFSESYWLRSNCRLIAFGGRPFTRDEYESAARAGMKDGQLVHRVGSDEELAAHYASAHAFVYPSLYEGFGFPMLEAMDLGCPVVASRASCLPEIAGDGAIYFEPHSAAELAHCLERLHDDVEFRQSLTLAGFDREKRFTWSACAKGTLDAYRIALQRTKS